MAERAFACQGSKKANSTKNGQHEMAVLPYIEEARSKFSMRLECEASI